MSESAVRDRINARGWGPFYWKLCLACGLGWMADSMCIAVLGLVLPIIMPLMRMTRAEAGFISSVTFVGFMLGGIVTGRLSDRLGRRTLMVYNILLFSIASGIAGFSTSYLMLLAVRFVQGVGLGGEFPVIATYLSEIAPARHRSRAVGVTSAFFAYGFVLTPLLAVVVVPILTWRGLFWILLLPVCAATWIRKTLPESPLFLLKNGRVEETEAALAQIEQGSSPESATLSFKSHPATEGFAFSWIRMIFLIAMWILTFLTQYGFVTWVPAVLALKASALGQTYLLTALLFTGMIVGFLSATFLGDRVPIKWLLVGSFAEFSVALFFFGHASTIVTTVFCGWLAATGYGLTTISMYVFTPMQFKPEIRGTGVGVATGVGRLGAIAGPPLVGVIAPSGGFDASFTVFAAAAGTAAALVILYDVAARRSAEPMVAAAVSE